MKEHSVAFTFKIQVAFAAVTCFFATGQSRRRQFRLFYVVAQPNVFADWHIAVNRYVQYLTDNIS